MSHAKHGLASLGLLYILSPPGRCLTILPRVFYATSESACKPPPTAAYVYEWYMGLYYCVFIPPFFLVDDCVNLLQYGL